MGQALVPYFGWKILYSLLMLEILELLLGGRLTILLVINFNGAQSSSAEIINQMMQFKGIELYQKMEESKKLEVS